MKPQFLLACASFATLTGCASVGGPAPRDIETPHVSGFTPVAIKTLPSSFCEDAAASDYNRLQMAGFDTASLERMTRNSLQQCRVLWAGNLDATSVRVAMR